MSTPQRQPTYFTNAEGRRLVHVPLSNHPGHFVAEADAFDDTRRRIGTNCPLFLRGDGKGRSYVATCLPGDRYAHHQFARLLLNCPKGYRARFLSDDRLNLLPENMRVERARYALKDCTWLGRDSQTTCGEDLPKGD